jgi:thioredoxin-like negative regulator of GroEL
MEYLAVDDLTIGASTVLAALGTAGAAAKAVWSYWTTKVDTLQQQHRDETVGQRTFYTEQIKQQDERITELQKELSRKSDDHAVKIEALQNVTLQQNDRAVEKLTALLERTIVLQVETNHTLQAFRDRNAPGG